MSRRSICFVLSSPYVLNAFLLTHIQALADHYDVYICCDTSESPISSRLDPRAQVKHFNIKRPVAPFVDIKTLFGLAAFFRKQKFDAVHSVTPKGGLLGMWAAWLAGVKLRTHIFTGQVWVTETGIKRKIFKVVDRAIMGFATDILADSPSQAKFLEAEGVARPGSVQILGDGSICGVDLDRFSSDAGRRSAKRKELGYGQDDVVFLFLGRLTHEKGALDTVSSFLKLALLNPYAKLLMVGPDEARLGMNLDDTLEDFPNQYKRLNLTDDVPEVLDAADVLCLPSYREGFGNVLIEAAAMGKPAIATRIYGISDAVLENEGAILTPVGDVEAISIAMGRMMERTFRHGQGEAAQKRTMALFPADRIRDLWLKFYERRFRELYP